ncbi:Apc15p protein-domain-containing protein [Xylaria palmicola]|nr:Apc15p protein-domain-containing protein [Xylaria palmicola]
MFGLLPDLSPRDSHSLWYTSPRNPFASGSAHDAHPHGPYNEPGHGHPHGANSHHRRGAHLIERSPLARLRADEQNLERRRQNVTNFGSAWLKPPGLPKTLHQLREERREAEEHQEAMRREQLAQELAEAEAANAGAGLDAAGGDPNAVLGALPGDGDGDGDGMDDVQLDGARDLDDDIPEAEAADFELSDNEDEDDDDDEEEEGEDEEEDDEDGNAEMRAAHAQQQQLMAQRMRQANDAFREDMARGRDNAAFYGADEDIDDEDQSQMIEEDDLVGVHGDMDDMDDMGDMGMDADLDGEIPEAESLGGYEHTDTEAELSSSSMDEDHNHNHNDSRVSFAPTQQGGRFRHSLAQSDTTRNSIAISDILSRDGSSVLGSSPAVPRPRAGPSSRRGRG